MYTAYPFLALPNGKMHRSVGGVVEAINRSTVDNSSSNRNAEGCEMLGAQYKTKGPKAKRVTSWGEKNGSQGVLSVYLSLSTNVDST